MLEYAFLSWCVSVSVCVCHPNPLRGPVVMIRFELGVLSRGKLGKTELMSEYIHTGQLQQVIPFFMVSK